MLSYHWKKLKLAEVEVLESHYWAPADTARIIKDESLDEANKQVIFLSLY